MSAEYYTIDFNTFKTVSKLPENLKTKKIYIEWSGHFDYYYYRERHGEGESIHYADSVISKNHK